MTEFNHFCDISHWEGDVDFGRLKALGHKLVIMKASDGYYMPSKDSAYTYDEEHHVDAWFVDNVRKAVEADMLWAPYHFVRFTNTFKNAFPDTLLAAKQLQYLEGALERLPGTQGLDVRTVVIDVEEPSNTLIERGVSAARVCDMMLNVVDLYCERFDHVIMYTGSWWSNQWLDEETRAYIAENVTLWEAEYRTSVGLVETPEGTKGLLHPYVPTVSSPFKQEYATSVDDMIGSIFALQYTDKGKVAGHSTGFDMNITAFSDEELDYLFKPYSEVPQPPPYEEDILTVLAYNMSLVQQKLDMMFEVLGIILKSVSYEKALAETKEKPDEQDVLR